MGKKTSKFSDIIYGLSVYHPNGIITIPMNYLKLNHIIISGVSWHLGVVDYDISKLFLFHYILLLCLFLGFYLLILGSVKPNF